ncbi:hypothetical protein GUJ93_ZPchr0013g36590 [Zizania palustris]|uniref:Uncharacterized protein n=1 Tax=Zizania palustris TaxID=103762 RepID=A0A8J5WWP9_ZIZPA|nr:hypothetical protein GUJ93_ZPchr0013g36590 [Zizania palustris]
MWHVVSERETVIDTNTPRCDAMRESEYATIHFDEFERDRTIRNKRAVRGDHAANGQRRTAPPLGTPPIVRSPESPVRVQRIGIGIGIGGSRSSCWGIGWS